MSQIANEFSKIDVDKLVYNINSLNDISMEITSDSSLDVSLSNLLRILMGTLGSTKGCILTYAPFKLAFETAVVKGFEGNLYFRALPKEVPEITSSKGVFTLEELEKKFPDFVKRNKPMFDKYASASIWVTLGIRGRLVGAILLGQKLNKEPYENTDILLLSIISNQIAIAISNFQLIDELKKTNDKLRKQNFELVDANYGISEMRQISVELSEIMDVHSLLETFLLKSIQYLSCSKGVLFHLEGENLRVQSSSKLMNMRNEKVFKVANSPDMIKKLLETGDSQRGDVNNFFEIDAKYVICVPLKAERDILGILCLFDKESKVEKDNPNPFTPFSERDEAMITSLTNHTATLWQKAKFYEMATVDGLTQLYVRRFFEQRIAEELRKAQRLDRKLSIMFIDIDHFKKFNDTYGHQTGDDVLRTVAKKIKDSVRKGIDIPARYGGEELTVVMPETDANGAVILAERIRLGIERTPLENPNGGEPLKVTVSIGVSTFPDHAVNVQGLVEKADIAVYKSKGNGRNRSTLYGQE
ncbi:MAG: diguanylate cyclase [Candidatus Sericytochromatia bacterium]